MSPTALVAEDGNSSNAKNVFPAAFLSAHPFFVPQNRKLDRT